MRAIYALALTSLALLAACTQQSPPADRDRVIAAIQQIETAQADAVGRKDLDSALSVFADDTTLYLPGMPPAKGIKAIKAVHERAMQDPAQNVVIDDASRKWWISAGGDLATTTYTYVWTHTDASSHKAVTEHIISQTTWAKQADGSWKNVSDVNAVYLPPTG